MSRLLLGTLSFIVWIEGCVLSGSMDHDFHKEMPPTLAQIAKADNVDITSIPEVHTELEGGLDIGSATTPAPLGNAEVATGHAVQSQGHNLTQQYEQFFKVAREAQADRSKRPQELLNDGGFKEMLVWASENMGQIKEEGLQDVCFAAKPFPQVCL